LAKKDFFWLGRLIRRFAATLAEGRNQGAASQKAERNKPFAILPGRVVAVALFFGFFFTGNLICNSYVARFDMAKVMEMEENGLENRRKS